MTAVSCIHTNDIFVETWRSSLSVKARSSEILSNLFIHCTILSMNAQQISRACYIFVHQYRIGDIIYYESPHYTYSLKNIFCLCPMWCKLLKYFYISLWIYHTQSNILILGIHIYWSKYDVTIWIPTEWPWWLLDWSISPLHVIGWPTF